MSHLKNAIKLAQSGQSDRAAEILRDLIQANPDDLYAWIWLAECTTDTAEARYAARHVLHIRPTNQRALLILEELGEEQSNWIPHWHLPKRKHDRPSQFPRPVLLIAGGILLGLATLIMSFALFTDIGDDNIIEAANQPVNRVSDDQDTSSVSIDERDSSSQPPRASSSEKVVQPDDDLDPEALTIDWIRDILSGKESADISFNCDNEARTGLQGVLEPFAERLLEYGIQTALRTLQVDAVFSVIEVIDDQAEYQVDGKIIVEVLGQRIESPPFSTVIRFVSDQGRWLVCEVAG